MNFDILAFGAHPDDIEFGCGGILAKAAAQNKSIVMVDVTRGDKASNGTPEMRRREGDEAAKLIGAKRICLNFNDCEVIDNYEGRLKFVQVLRQFHARLILAPMWKGEQMHPDHLACGVMARYACRYARFSKILPDLPPYQPEGILHYLAPTNEKIDFLIDVSEYVDTWKQMMDKHQSQMVTYPYSEWVLKDAARLGSMINRPYAQGLMAGNPVVIEDLNSIARSAREL